MTRRVFTSQRGKTCLILFPPSELVLKAVPRLVMYMCVCARVQARHTTTAASSHENYPNSWNNPALSQVENENEQVSQAQIKRQYGTRSYPFLAFQRWRTSLQPGLEETVLLTICCADFGCAPNSSTRSAGVVSSPPCAPFSVQS